MRKILKIRKETPEEKSAAVPVAAAAAPAKKPAAGKGKKAAPKKSVNASLSAMAEKDGDGEDSGDD